VFLIFQRANTKNFDPTKSEHWLECGDGRGFWPTKLRRGWRGSR